MLGIVFATVPKTTRVGANVTNVGTRFITTIHCAVVFIAMAMLFVVLVVVTALLALGCRWAELRDEMSVSTLAHSRVGKFPAVRQTDARSFESRCDSF